MPPRLMRMVDERRYRSHRDAKPPSGGFFMVF